MESAWPRTMAASRGESLRAGSGRRALALSPEPVSEGRSEAKLTSRSLFWAMARKQLATARLKGSWGASDFCGGLRLVLMAQVSATFTELSGSSCPKHR